MLFRKKRKKVKKKIIREKEKPKIKERTNSIDTSVDTVIEHKKFKFKETNLGWDCGFTRKEFRGHEPIFENEIYVVYDQKDPKAIVKDILKLSMPEKQLYISVFNYIKDLPLLDIENDIRKYLQEYCEDNSILIEKEQVDYLHKLLIFEITGFGPVTTLLKDKDDMEELVVIGLGEEYPVYIYISKIGWVKTNIYFSDDEYVRELINRMSRSIGRRITFNQPLLNAALPDGSRLNAIIPPISNKYPSLTLRRFRYNPLTPLDLINFNTFSSELATFFWLALQTDSNFLIAGNTGSGKTTTLNALFSFIPKSERVIIAEETPEVNIPHPHQVRLRIDQNIGISMNDLIVSTLRMRPDRLIVGEIRDSEEVKSFLDTILAGQGKGSFATFHGLSANDAIQRLFKLGMLEQDLNALDLIIVQRRWNIYNLEKNQKSEVRKIVSISEIVDGNPIELFAYDYKKDKWTKVNESKRLKSKIEITFQKDYNLLFNIYQKKINDLMKENKEEHYSLTEFFEKVSIV
jgi:Flp pilus assembly CpaF family ATPase